MHYWEENIITHLDRSISASKHKENLAKIKSRESERLNVSLPSIRQSAKQSRLRNQEIIRANGILKNKLITITRQDRIISPISMTPTNFIKLKKIKDKRIEHENKILAHRIEANSSMLSYKTLSKDYKKYSKIKQNLSKTKLQNRIKKLLKPAVKLIKHD